ncbi:MAG: hypothetical protein ACP5ID_04460 [Conexivisphaera sp.]
MGRRISARGLPDPLEAAELALSVAEASGASGFQYRVRGPGELEILLDGDEGLAEDLARMIEEIWPGASASVEAYGGRVMDVDLFKRVLHVLEHPDEARERRQGRPSDAPNSRTERT